MRVLIDECAPKALERFLSEKGHECPPVQEAGWFGKRNGELLDLAETNFDVFVTVDANLPYQQNLTDRKIAVVTLRARTYRMVIRRRAYCACLPCFVWASSMPILVRWALIPLRGVVRWEVGCALGFGARP